jgi:hypothetical protein
VRNLIHIEKSNKTKKRDFSLALEVTIGKLERARWKLKMAKGKYSKRIMQLNKLTESIHFKQQNK